MGVKRTGIDCFAGIGGFSLAMRNCGIEPKVQIEIDEYCQIILKKNFPKAKRFRDICTVSANDLRRVKPWILCGGFPCQDVSAAGKGVGANEGDRSGLWREMWRLIRTTRPTWLLIENVPALRTRGADSVLVALEALGYSAWSLVVGALHVGAPHQRQRVWIVAHAEGDLRGAPWNHRLESLAWSSAVENTESKRFAREQVQAEQPGRVAITWSGSVEHSKSIGTRQRSLRGRSESSLASITNTSSLPDADGNRIRQQPRRGGRSFGREAFVAARGREQFDWECPRAVESGLGRTIDGLPGRLDKHRIKALGNAIVPQVAEAILRAIIAIEETN